MRAYYWRKEGKKEFYLVPGVLFGYDTNGKINSVFNPNILENFNLSLQKDKLNRNILEKKGFEFYSVEIPERLVKRFIQECSNLERYTEKDKNNLDKVLKLADLVFNSILDNALPITETGEDEEVSSSYRDSYYDGYSINDYEDEWYLRGEEPPSVDDFSDDG